MVKVVDAVHTPEWQLFLVVREKMRVRCLCGLASLTALNVPKIAFDSAPVIPRGFVNLEN